MVDAVLSYHLNPQTCGVAKFNQQLAAKLGVPMLKLGSRGTRHPLVSVKMSEHEHPSWLNVGWPYDLFLHDYAEGPAVTQASRVYVGNKSLAERLRPIRPDVIEAFCPSTINGDPTRGAYRVLVFGMAHKLNLPHFAQLKARLDVEHPDYTIELSTAVHEGTPWDDALTDAISAMRSIFGARLRVLGFLADDAIALALRDVDAVACYFTPALRANNTSYWAAVEAGKPVYTNRDEYSPAEGDAPATWEKLLEIVRA